MNKGIISLALAGALASGVMAEENGAFVGLEVGYGELGISGQLAGQVATQTEDAIKYGLVAGYKQFFNPHIGLRYYANISFYESQGASGPGATGGENLTSVLNYGANIDFLGNFIATEYVDFGGFIGVGIGANTWFNQTLQDAKDLGLKVSDTGFNFALNVGLRTNLFAHHGIEVAARIPLTSNTVFDESITNSKVDFDKTYSVTARYIFSF